MFPTYNADHKYIIDNYNRLDQTIYVTPEYIKRYSALKNHLLESDPGLNQDYALVKFLSLPTYLASSYIDESGQSTSLIIPMILLKPPAYNESFYPLNQAQNDFDPDRPYNYLATFDESTLRDKTDDGVKGRVLEAVKNSVYFLQAQSRFSKVWKQVTSAILTVDLLLGTTDHIFRHFINALFIGKAGFKIIEISGFKDATKFEFTENGVPSILPTLLYGLKQCITGFASGSLTHYTSVLCLQQYLLFTVGSFQDNVLDQKDGYTDWVYQGLAELKEIVTLHWNYHAKPEFAYKKKIIRTAIRDNQIISSKENRKKLNQQAQTYINSTIKNAKSNNDIFNGLSAARYFLDTGTYLDSIDELITDKAVMPTVQVRAVPAAKSTLVTHPSMDDETYTYALEFEDPFLKQITKYNDQFKALAVSELNKINLDSMWRDLLTTSSAGVSVPIDLKKLVTKGQASSMHSRLIIQAWYAKRYRDKLLMYKNYSVITKAGKRLAILRRVRRLNNSNNEILQSTIPPYAAGNATFNAHKFSATGAQKGNYFDFWKLLYWTSQNDTLLSSTDVKGMDANMQDSVKDIFAKFVFDVLADVRQILFGPFITRNIILQDRRGNAITKEISAAHDSFAFAHSMMRSATKYQSKIFQRAMVNREGAFSSGIQYTSTNHIFVLVGCLGVVEDQRISRGAISTSTYHIHLGDDLCKADQGHFDDTDSHVLEDAKGIEQLGFKTTLEISDTTAVFLQQQISSGTYRGFPDRVALFTREKMRIQKNLHGASNELNALGYDLLHRARNINGLKLLLFNINQYCIGYMTYELTSSVKESLTTLLKQANLYHKMYPITDRKTFLCTVYAPFMWSFLSSGGNLPSFPTIRRDGTYTYDQYLTTPTGDYLRRYLYDVSDIRMSLVTRTAYLDAEHLNSLGFDAAETFAYLDQYDIKMKAKRDLVDPALVNKLGLNLEEMIATSKYRQSRLAFNELKRLTGKELPHDIVFGLKTFERIIDTITQGTLKNELNVTFITDTLIQHLKLHLAKKIIKNTYTYSNKKGKDEAHCFLFYQSDADLYSSEQSRGLFHAQLTSAMPQFSPLWHIIQYTTWSNNIGAELKQALSASKGKYKSFAYDSNEFKSALEMYNRSPREKELFYNALQASPEYKATLEQAVQYFIAHNSPNYLFSINPRQLMFLPEDASSYLPFLDIRETKTNSMQLSYKLTTLQAFILAHPHYIGRKRYQFIGLKSYV